MRQWSTWEELEREFFYPSQTRKSGPVTGRSGLTQIELEGIPRIPKHIREKMAEGNALTPGETVILNEVLYILHCTKERKERS